MLGHTMRTVDSKCHARTISILGAVIAVLIALLEWQGWSYFRLHLESKFAEEQTHVFDDLRAQALQSDASGAAGCLQHLLIYYPSGSKQRTGSHLDRIVERHRVAVARDIISYLRGTTCQELGDKPEAWIERYARRD